MVVFSDNIINVVTNKYLLGQAHLKVINQLWTGEGFAF